MTGNDENRAPLNLGYAIPPPLFPPPARPPRPEVPAPGVVPRRRHRARRVDGAFVSGALSVLSLAGLLVALAVVAV
ncbi:hypothetical protein [Streptomyces malaysiense]|uniref:Uncharacterized protein n=1 Tax=Streptomyces malaysiense TaxID=1428626 RepID=A0A1J4PXY0_9ACTN|nr:hypothetical protein [Streptomyces malaysiense]OIK25765.1 hypothetical protein VT52_020055 [Streptomyces malaysiense]